MTAREYANTLIRAFEGCRLEAYQDPGGVWTIGWGETAGGIHEGLIWTQEQADTTLALRIATPETEVRSSISSLVPVTDAMIGALISFGYNVGAGAEHTSTLLHLLNTGDYLGAVGQFRLWVHQDTEVLPGLVRRRNAEALCFFTGVVHAWRAAREESVIE
ncbi:MAG TPA: lysozyme [Chloroflexota bacterium]|nr:lysozyme [Chloroflexota bacterium]